MREPHSYRASPAPADDEAAAIAAAITAYLAERRAAGRPTPPENRWALAGRLTSQGRAYARARGVRTTWGAVTRLSRASSRQ